MLIETSTCLSKFYLSIFPDSVYKKHWNCAE